MLRGQSWDRRAVPAALVLLALWLPTHPWDGLWHDSRLYAVQALHRLMPQQFAGDLFFLYGSQDAFTLFSPLYAALIAACGLDTAAMLVQGVGSMLWVGAAAFLLAAFLRGLPFWVGLALLVALPADYGPMITMFNIGEAFPTPRLLAEGLGMLAMGCAVRRRWAWALPALALGALLHPLMTAGVALFGVLYLAEGRRRLVIAALLLASGIGAAGGAAWLGIAPFDGLLRTMDAEWYAHVVAMTPAVAWDGWRLAEWGSRTALAFSLVLAAARLLPAPRARFFGCVAVAGALGLLASWVGTGLVHNQLLMQAQPWRVLWLVQLASAMALACLWPRYWRQGRLMRALLLAFCVAILTRNTIGGLLGMLAAALLCWQGQRAQPRQLTRREYGLALLVLAGLAGALPLELGAGPAWSGIFGNDFPLASRDTLWLFILLKRGAAALLGVGLLVLVWRVGGSGRRGALAAASALALAVLAGGAALALAQARASAALRLPAPAQAAVRQAFLPLIAPGAVVYWQNDVSASWFLLQRANYASNTQMAGMVFNRGTAVEGRRRLARLERLGVADSVRLRSRVETSRVVEQLPPPSRAGLAHACADPALDFVVLRHKLGGEVALVSSAGHLVYLHACARLRAAR
jgi:hypothetical protein